MKQIKGLDSLRALAIIIVIYAHWTVVTFNPNPIINFINEYIVPDGHTGVDLFFVLSGFLITSILLNAKEKSKPTAYLSVVKNFMIRRALRIFPVYYLMIFTLLAIGYEGVKLDLGYLLTYTSNIHFFRTGQWGALGHTWSLAVEEQFYIFWPWLILFVNNKYLKYVFIGSIIVSTLCNYYCYYVIDRGSFPFLVFNCIECFGIGGFYAWARLNEAHSRKFEQWVFPLFLACLLIYFYWRYQHGAFWNYTTFLFRIVDGLIALQLIIWVMNNRVHWIQKYVLENRVLNYIGKISYGIYLFHDPLQPLYDGFMGRLMTRHPGLPAFLGNYYFSYAAKIVILLIICSLSYRFFELPFLNLKKRFAYQN